MSTLDFVFRFLGRAPTVEELRAAGLPPAWVGVAEAVGVEPFLAVWAVLESSAPEDRRVYVPALSALHRAARARWVRAQVAAGVSTPEIFRRLTEMRDPLSYRQLLRLASVDVALCDVTKRGERNSEAGRRHPND